MKLSIFVAVTGLLSSVSAKPTVYLIRHGEKPSNGANGLSSQGQQRAQCLRSVFGANSQYHIGYILAEQPKKDGSRARPYQTVQPLASDLGLTVDTHCDRDDSDCAASAVQNYSSSGNVLICWEHDALTDIAESLGASNPPTYPDSHYDLIWTDPSPYSKIVSITSEHCQGLDS